VPEVATQLDVALAAAATLIATAFALSTWDRWLRKRRPQEEAWTISLVLFAIGSGALWWGFARGWSAASFRTFYLTGAILNVPWLALGTLSLVMDPTRVRQLRTWMIALSGLATGVLLAAPIKGPVPSQTLPEGRELFGIWPRVLAAVGSGVAAIVIIAVAIVTTYRFARQRTSPGRRVIGNVTIAVGTLILSASGTLAGRLGEQRAFVVTLLVGIAVLFTGFLATAVPARRASRPGVQSHRRPLRA
jgi:hypothetical protein